jgi:hypothetical protein
MNPVPRIVLIFPPNWTACASGPHLAMPLLAGTTRGTLCNAETWDLSQEFYCTNAVPPSRPDVIGASQNRDFILLDQLYFDWEDQLRSLLRSEDAANFGLFSGFDFPSLESMPLATVAEVVRHQGTVYTRFLSDRVLPRLVSIQPRIVGITIASHEQVIPALELLTLVRQALPTTFIVLGGNVVTRLRDTPAFETLCKHADQTVIFQGDLAFREIVATVARCGVEIARQQLPRVAGDEAVPTALWPVPAFGGLHLHSTIGIPVLPYVSTRGCYYGRCSFCAIPAAWSKSGYAGSLPEGPVVAQLLQLVAENDISRFKFVDEAVAPGKARQLSARLCEFGAPVEWEAYARLESAWEDINLLEQARAGGLRKLYFGLEQAPTPSRKVFGKNDRGDPQRILQACSRAGIAVHLFCMVGHPGTSREDASATVRFLLENESRIDTADLVGFRLDRGTRVSGVKPVQHGDCDWRMALRFEPTESNILCEGEVKELEEECQEALWRETPRLLHPLYRLVGPWSM